MQEWLHSYTEKSVTAVDSNYDLSIIRCLINRCYFCLQSPLFQLFFDVAIVMVSALSPETIKRQPL